MKCFTIKAHITDFFQNSIKLDLEQRVQVEDDGKLILSYTSTLTARL